MQQINHNGNTYFIVVMALRTDADPTQQVIDGIVASGKMQKSDFDILDPVSAPQAYESVYPVLDGLAKDDGFTYLIRDAGNAIIETYKHSTSVTRAVRLIRLNAEKLHATAQTAEASKDQEASGYPLEVEQNKAYH
jgi:hypothetical protein